MFAVKTSQIMVNLQPGKGNAVASASPRNEALFQQLATKAKVSPALVKAAFTRANLNRREGGSYVHYHRDLEKLAAYVQKKANNRDVADEDKVRLLLVHSQLSRAVTERMNELLSHSLDRRPRVPGTAADDRPQRPMLRDNPVSKRQREREASRRAKDAGGTTAVRPVPALPIEEIRARVKAGDREAIQMNSAEDKPNFDHWKGNAQKTYGDAIAQLWRVIVDSPPNSAARRDAHAERLDVMKKKSAVNKSFFRRLR